MQRITRFVEDVLPRDLQLAQEELQRVTAQQQEYEQLLADLQGMQQAAAGSSSSSSSAGNVTRAVDLGAGVRCDARVLDSRSVCLEVGLGFYVECDCGGGAELGEAGRVVRLRLEALAGQASGAAARVDNIRAHLEALTHGLAELQQLQKLEQSSV